MTSPILKHFRHEDPSLLLQDFVTLAHSIEATVPDGPEKSAGLRKLLEALDCIARARLG